MANDIIGAPEPFVIGGHVFHLSPLNDFEFAKLASWCTWRLTKKIEVDSHGFFKELQTAQGATQLLSVSLERTKPTSVEESALFLSKVDADVSIELFNFWYELNYTSAEYPKPDIKQTTSKRRELVKLDMKSIRERTYRYLAQKYSWTFQQIMLMTPYQQFCAAYRTQEERTLHFSTDEEYAAWAAKQLST